MGGCPSPPGQQVNMPLFQPSPPPYYSEDSTGPVSKGADSRTGWNLFTYLGTPTYQSNSLMP